MEWPIHQLGGSTFETSGGAAVRPAAIEISRNPHLKTATERMGAL